MSDEKPKVEMAKFGSGRVNYHESLAYIREKKTTIRAKKWIGVGAAAASIAYISLGGSSIQKPTKSPTDSFHTSMPHSSSLPIYNRGAQAQSSLHARGARRTLVAKVFPGPAVISRKTTINPPPGTEAKAMLVTGGSLGFVKAKLTEDVQAYGQTYFEAGTVLIGQGSSSSDRLYIHFTKAVDPEGEIASTQADAASEGDKTLGLPGSFFSIHGTQFLAGAALNFLAGASEAMQDTQGEQGAVVAKPTMRNAILNGTAQAALNESTQIASQYKDNPPAIEIHQGTKIIVIFSGG